LVEAYLTFKTTGLEMILHFVSNGSTL